MEGRGDEELGRYEPVCPVNFCYVVTRHGAFGAVI